MAVSLMSKAWVYTLCYNEAQLIGYWVRHHRTFCDKVIVYVANDSTDGTAEIAASEGADVRPYVGSGYLDDNEFVQFANIQYRESIGQADWVIWLDADEILYHAHASQYLEILEANGVTIPLVEQYVMSAPGIPTHPGQIYDDPKFRNGYLIPDSDKLAIFNPNVLNISWIVGKHKATSIEGKVVRDSGEYLFKVLHYRWLGREYIKARDARNYARLSGRAKAASHGFHTYPEFVGPYDEGWLGPRPEDAKAVLS